MEGGEFRKLLIDCHSTKEQCRVDKKYKCLYCEHVVQKHRLNIHRFHGCPQGPEDRETGEKAFLPCYPTLPWGDTKKAVTYLEAGVPIPEIFYNLKRILPRAGKEPSTSKAVTHSKPRKRKLCAV